MISSITRVMFYILLAVVALITVATQVINHQENIRRWEKVEVMTAHYEENIQEWHAIRRLINDPQARPDAWTKTQDDAKMAACREEMRQWVNDNFARKDK